MTGICRSIASRSHRLSADVRSRAHEGVVDDINHPRRFCDEHRVDRHSRPERPPRDHGLDAQHGVPSDAA